MLILASFVPPLFNANRDVRYLVVPSSHEEDGYIKTLNIKRHRSTQEDKRILEDFQIIIPKQPKKVSSCPLYDEYNAKNFLILMFEKSCRRVVMQHVVTYGLCVSVNRVISHYKFFGHSPTQLRQGTCILYNACLEDIYETHEKMISRFGTFDKNNVSKRAARIGLLLSSAKKVIELTDEQVKLIDDKEDSKGRKFTDGCGLISLEIAQKIRPCLFHPEQYQHQKYSYPSVYQIRFKGCKGILMLTLDPQYKGCIAIRDSLIKFKWNPNMKPYYLRIVDEGKAVSFPNRFGALNTQFIRLLSALGVKDDIFLRKQEVYFTELSKILDDPEIQVRYLCAYKNFDMAEKIISGEIPDEEMMKKLKKLQATCYLPKSSQDAMAEKRQIKVKLKLPLDKSRHVFGVADPSEKLEYGTCFFQPTIRGTPTVLEELRVVVAKSPSYHLGDIRVLKCVNVRECQHLVDCIVFPVKGPRPHPDEIAGSDLDGDEFFVCWDEQIIPPQCKPPTSYSGTTSRARENVTYKDLQKYFYEYDRHMPSTLDKYFCEWADAKGADCEECQLIANIFNQAIDSAKTGKEIEIPRLLHPAPEPAADRFVWQKMVKCVRRYQQSMALDACSNRNSEMILLFTFQEIQSYLKQKDSIIPEYQLFRLAYKWCRCQQQSHLESLLSCIDLKLMNDEQQNWITTQLQHFKYLNDTFTYGAYRPSNSPKFSAETIQFVDDLVLNVKLQDAVKADAANVFDDWSIFSLPPGLSDIKEINNQIIRAWIIRLRERKVDEFCLYKLIFAWCQAKTNFLLSELMLDIDFSRLTHSQRKLALVDLEPLGAHFARCIENALYRSTIFTETDLEQLTQKLDVPGPDWVKYHEGHSCSQSLWKQLNDILVTDMVKMIVFKFLINGTNWAIAIFIPEVLSLHETRQVSRSQRRTRVYVSVHDSTMDSCLTPLSDDYYLALDGQRLQIFIDNPRKDRTQTFVCLMNLEHEHDSIGLSVALNRLNRNDFAKDHNNARVRREEIQDFEIFLNRLKPMVAPAIFVHHCEQYKHRLDTACPAAEEQFSYDEFQFPSLTEDPGLELNKYEHQMQEIEWKFFEYKQKIKNGLTREDVAYWIQLMHKPSEVSPFAANRFAALLSEIPQVQESWINSEVYFSTLRTLVRNGESYTTITGLLETLTKHSRQSSQQILMSCKQFGGLINDIIYCCADRTCAKKLLRYIRVPGHVPLDDDEFYSPTARKYFIYWLPLISLELITEVMTHEQSLEIANNYCEAHPFVDEFTVKDVVRRKVILNIHGSEQPFQPTDGLTLSFGKERKPLFFAEMSEMTGMMLTLRVVWPEFGDQILKEMLRQNQNKGVKGAWRIDTFPNLVTFRRQLEAIKAMCVKGYIQPKPSSLIQRIISLSNWDTLAKKSLRKAPTGSDGETAHGTRSGTVSIEDQSSGGEQLSAGGSLGEREASANKVGSRTPLHLPSDVLTDEPEPMVDIRSFIPKEDILPLPRSTALPPRFSGMHLEDAASSATALTHPLEPTNSVQQKRVKTAPRRGIPPCDDLNDCQRNAVELAINEELAVIHGPPGTGKTKTAACIVREWLKIDPNSRVLVTAESNEAVNNLFQKMCQVGIKKEKIVRVGRREKISEDIREFGFEEHYLQEADPNQRKHFDSKLADKIFEQVQVVCTTCMGAGAVPLRNTKFWRVLIDEAAQATEPSALVALCSGAQTVCIIGDDKQLPPLVKCGNEEANDLKISLFERLHGSAGVPVCMLDIQYRMHPSIAMFPSQEFYRGMIKNGVREKDRPMPLGIDWPNRQMPMVFYNVQNGYDECDKQSKLNWKEADVVVDVVNKFLDAGNIRLADIGVITPYRAQKTLLSKKLENTKIDVRTVDGFQGQEREIIIFSAVRANDDGRGLKQVGFLKDLHRANVLLTRARCGLVVIGNRDTLSSDELWNKWIDFMDKHGLVEVRDAGASDGGHQPGIGQHGGRGQRGRGGRGGGDGRGGRGGGGRGGGGYRGRGGGRGGGGRGGPVVGRGGNVGRGQHA